LRNRLFQKFLMNQKNPMFLWNQMIQKILMSLMCL
jgi:hypothetical protein